LLKRKHKITFVVVKTTTTYKMSMQLLKLQVTNAEQLVYDNGLLILTVLGGVKLEGLDRMRVTLKLELPDSPRPPLRHNLDLYNDNQLEKLIELIKFIYRTQC